MSSFFKRELHRKSNYIHCVVTGDYNFADVALNTYFLELIKECRTSGIHCVLYDTRLLEGYPAEVDRLTIMSALMEAHGVYLELEGKPIRIAFIGEEHQIEPDRSSADLATGTGLAVIITSNIEEAMTWLTKL